MAKIVPNTEHLTAVQKKQKLDAIAESINKKANKIICGRIAQMPEIQEKLQIKWIPTPSYKVNRATGGGFPIGKFTIISGNEDSGK